MGSGRALWPGAGSGRAQPKIPKIKKVTSELKYILKDDPQIEKISIFLSFRPSRKSKK